ncbi:single-stranded-DNA-specific exonuclease RecJ [Thermithiobacillus plumbiphilus]|uniref:Single-stranded-DNA-specific exonuclease RecJ n=1 Tax=Thermithiobacillus plumbiphilus TaxID=1729899 RepID=A0ABU9DBI3_9PROT
MSQLVQRTFCETQASRLQADGIPPLLARIYAARGVTDAAQLRLGLDALASPQQVGSGLKGLHEAAQILGEAIVSRQKILVVGDFDCDGATSTALCMEALLAMGAQEPCYLVPNRFEYGYGLTPEIVELARDLRPQVLMTVDNGISSIEGVRAARSAGMRVVVTDHHLPGHMLPEADAIVNPNQPGCPFPWKNSAGVAVAFYVMTAVRNYLRQQGYFSDARPEPRLASLLDLLALGTVADVVPLDDNNRILVTQGLARIRSGKARPGIRALLEVAGRPEDQVMASDMGFAVGPRLNAAGRLADMSLGIRCLLARDMAQARAMAQELDSLNRERRSIEAVMQAEATNVLVDDDLLARRWGLCLYNDQWHQGVIGILAGRVKEQCHRPVIAFARVADDEIKGSARSIQGLHMRDALDAVAAKHPGLLAKFGGHAMAAGLSLRLIDLPVFADAFDAQVRSMLRPEDLQQVLETDGPLAADELSVETAMLLRAAGPWGQGFPEPLFEGVFDIVDFRVLKEKHLKLSLRHPAGPMLDAIHFGCVPRLGVPSGKRLRAAYVPEINEFGGRRTVQLRLSHWECMD